jgi:hypothetical protein
LAVERKNKQKKNNELTDNSGKGHKHAIIVVTADDLYVLYVVPLCFRMKSSDFANTFPPVNS